MSVPGAPRSSSELRLVNGEIFESRAAFLSHHWADAKRCTRLCGSSNWRAIGRRRVSSCASGVYRGKRTCLLERRGLRLNLRVFTITAESLIVLPSLSDDDTKTTAASFYAVDLLDVGVGGRDEGIALSTRYPELRGILRTEIYLTAQVTGKREVTGTFSEIYFLYSGFHGYLANKRESNTGYFESCSPK